MYVIVTNHVNWHRENLQSDREKQGQHREFENIIRVGTLNGTFFFPFFFCNHLKLWACASNYIPLCALFGFHLDIQCTKYASKADYFTCIQLNDFINF